MICIYPFHDSPSASLLGNLLILLKLLLLSDSNLFRPNSSHTQEQLVYTIYCFLHFGAMVPALLVTSTPLHRPVGILLHIILAWVFAEVIFAVLTT